MGFLDHGDTTRCYNPVAVEREPGHEGAVRKMAGVIVTQRRTQIDDLACALLQQLRYAHLDEERHVIVRQPVKSEANAAFETADHQPLGLVEAMRLHNVTDMRRKKATPLSINKQNCRKRVADT